jgi:hypothetical protein
LALSTSLYAGATLRSTEIKRAKRFRFVRRWQTVPAGTRGDFVSEQEDALARVMNLMRDLERLLIEIKEAVIPVLVGSNEPIETAWRARTFLRLADRMLEDMHELLHNM